MYLDEVTYLCNLGYLINGTGLAKYTITCQIDGTWSNEVPTCESKSLSHLICADLENNSEMQFLFNFKKCVEICDCRNIVIY